MSVRVTVPRRAILERVDARVLAQAKWIRSQLRRFEWMQPLPAPRRYVSGECHLYLGRQYRLRLAAGEEHVTLSGGRLLVRVPGRRSSHQVQTLLEGWYRAKAAEVFRRRLHDVFRRVGWLHRGEVELRIRSMSTKWGSCGPGGLITLNVELVKAPVSCIDYVLIHELCHRLELKHSRRFYTLLRRAVPDWERARDRLNAVVR